jgi:hypothetical protein
MEDIPDKIYCEECRKDIAIESLDDGSIVIHCPKCIGECSLCDCHLVSQCFSDTPKVVVRHLRDMR